MGYPSSKWGRHTEREVAMWRVFRNGKTVAPSNGIKRETNLTSNSANSGMKNSSLLLGRGRGRHTANPERQRNCKPMSKPMPIGGFALARLPKERAKTVFSTLEHLEESGMLSFRYAKKTGISYEEWIAGQHLFLSSVSGRKDEMREYLFGV